MCLGEGLCGFPSPRIVEAVLHAHRKIRVPAGVWRSMVDLTPEEPDPADAGIVEVWKRRRDPSEADRTAERLDDDPTPASSEPEPDHKDSAV